MKCLTSAMMCFLMVWTLLITLLLGSLSHATEIDGHWLAEDPSGGRVFFYFGAENTFYIETETSWVQGSYTLQSETYPKQLDLHIDDGTNVEDMGRKIHYRYDIQDNSLILSGTHHPTTLTGQDSSDRYVYIGINNDSSDEDDDEDDSNFSLYASCFINGLTSI